jgi:hypothetical protein
MASYGMLRRVALVRSDVSEELSASFIRVTGIGELGTTQAVTSNRRSASPFFIVTFVAIEAGCNNVQSPFVTHVEMLGRTRCDITLLPETADRTRRTRRSCKKL